LNPSITFCKDAVDLQPVATPIVIPIAVFMGIALLGYLAGGIVLASAWMASQKR